MFWKDIVGRDVTCVEMRWDEMRMGGSQVTWYGLMEIDEKVGVAAHGLVSEK